MSDRIARIVLAVVSGLLLLAALAVDLPRVSDGRFWSDGATYYAMAGSIARDGDLEFGPRDLARVRASYPGGPQGVFLKRVAGPAGPRLVYAKALVYPLLAAPWVLLLGADRGLPALNAAVLVGSLWLGYALLRAGSSRAVAVAGTLAVFLGGVVPAYLLWQTPEILDLGLVTLGLFAWRRGRPLLGAVLIGVAAYAKPTNAALALPLLLEPLLATAPAGAESLARRWRARILVSARRGLVAGLVFAAGFGVNWLATGELNYQGGERKTFYDRYPFDPGVSFDSAGVWMTTDHLGPLVAGRDEDEGNERVAPPRSRRELRQSFLLNLFLFWIGRFGGVLPYYPGVAAALLLFLLVGPRERAGWLALLALVVSWLGYILIIPDNWYGGAGAIGNRYFVNLVPLGLLLLPSGRGGWAAALALPPVVLLLGPTLATPVQSALDPGQHATRAAFRRLPAELTMLGDLSVFTDVWRKRRPYNAPGGDPARRPPGAPPSYFLWFLDDGSFGQETSFGEEGFWLRGGESTQVVLQTLAPPRSIRLVVTSGPAGDIVTVRLGSDRQRLVMGPLETRRLSLVPARPVGYYGTELYLLRLGSRYGGPAARDPRELGSFVRIVLEEQGGREASSPTLDWSFDSREARGAMRPAPCAGARRDRGRSWRSARRRSPPGASGAPTA